MRGELLYVRYEKQSLLGKKHPREIVVALPRPRLVTEGHRDGSLVRPSTAPEPALAHAALSMSSSPAGDTICETRRKSASLPRNEFEICSIKPLCQQDTLFSRVKKGDYEGLVVRLIIGICFYFCDNYFQSDLIVESC